MSNFANLVKVLTATTGTGTMTLGAAATGFRGTSALTNAAVYSYSILDGVAYETGTGTFTAAGTTLTRSVYESSNANAPIVLSGSAIVIVADCLAQDLALFAPLASPSFTGTALFNGTALGTAAFQNTGTSGATLPFLNGVNTWSAPQTVNATFTNPAAVTNLVKSTATINATSGANAQNAQVVFGIASVGASNTQNITGALAAVQGQASVSNGAAGTISTLQGGSFTSSNNSGTATVTAAKSLIATAPTVSNGGTIAFGVAGHLSPGTVATNNTTLLLSASVHGGNFAVYSDEALESFFGGGLVIGTPTGGYKGAATLNATTIYQNGTALAASATTDTTNASNITSGTLAHALLDLIVPQVTIITSGASTYPTPAGALYLRIRLVGGGGGSGGSSNGTGGTGGGNGGVTTFATLTAGGAFGAQGPGGIGGGGGGASGGNVANIAGQNGAFGGGTGQGPVAYCFGGNGGGNLLGPGGPGGWPGLGSGATPTGFGGGAGGPGGVGAGGVGGPGGGGGGYVEHILVNPSGSYSWSVGAGGTAGTAGTGGSAGVAGGAGGIIVEAFFQ